MLAFGLLAAAVLSAALAFWPRPASPLAVVAPTQRPTASPSPPLRVHVVGAVARPGVYELATGSRVEELVLLAGGMTDDADAASLNLAARLVDGQQLVIRSKTPTPAERTGPALESGPSGRLNLNTASAADLDTLPGVGPILAQRILERRQRSGPFQAIEQLRDEKLIPAATFERIKDLVAVS